ncbi:hypothetical protein [Erythrobacter alti]|uniref:hypothetical protein n=1 Tax=Erythrobacter alti TaxID=1896145 RepID=UPI0030F46C3E
MAELAEIEHAARQRRSRPPCDLIAILASLKLKLSAAPNRFPTKAEGKLFS